MRAVVALAAACSGTSNVTPKPGAAMTDPSCATAIRNFAAGKLADARLPASCSVADACAAIDALSHARDATGALGEDRTQVKWRAIEQGVAGERLLLWHDGERVLAVELEAPQPAGGWDALRTALGRPDVKLGYWNGVVEEPRGQWVYALRGLALYTALADTSLARAVVFPPTTIAGYRARLARATEPPRELEER